MNCWRLRLGTAAGCGQALSRQGRVILAIDGLQPDVGHEVLWVLRDCLSGEVLLAGSLLSSTPRRSSRSTCGTSARSSGRWRPGRRRATSRPGPSWATARRCAGDHDDGRPPLDASGLQLHERLTAVSASLATVEEKRGSRRNCKS